MEDQAKVKQLGETRWSVEARVDALEVSGESWRFYVLGERPQPYRKHGVGLDQFMDIREIIPFIQAQALLPIRPGDHNGENEVINTPRF